MKFRILGPLEVSDGNELVRVEGRKMRALLATLLVEAGDVVSADKLTSVLWSSSSPKGRLNALQSHVSRLRTVIGAADSAESARVMTHRSGYLIRVHEDELDALVFERLSRRARDAMATNDWQAAVDHADQALSCWRGDALEEFRDEDFARARATQLEEERLLTTECRVEASLSLGRHSQLVGELETLVIQHPLRESLWCQLILALYRSGRQSDALRAFDRIRRALAQELGVDPGVELVNLRQAVLTHDPSLDWPGPVPAESPRAGCALSVAGGRNHKGRHDGTCPAIHPREPRHNLPRRLSDLIGRSAERSALVEEIGRSRMVTLCGAGGCGKTRLALAVAEQLLPRFAGGVWFVDFSTIVDHTLVERAVAESLGVASETNHADHLCRHIGDDEVLLVLDNCEHLIDAVSLVAERLLACCPATRILATSREELRVDGEAVWRVPGLSLPVDGSAGVPFEESEAVQLFVQRGRSALASFAPTGEAREHVAHICRRLDGIPLAIELAAALVGSLPLIDIAERLDDRFRLLTHGRRNTVRRHRTLRATLDWSLHLLDEPARRLFARLGIFVGDFTLAAAEQVAGWDDDPMAVARGLRHLVATSMVESVAGPDGSERYRLLETVRQYAYEQLQRLDEVDDLRRRHAHYFAELAEDAEGHVHGPAAPEWLSRVVGELPNLRAAVAWTIENDDVETGLRLAGPLRWYLDRMGLLDEAARWLEVWLSQEERLRPELRLRALTSASTIAFMRGQFNYPRRWGEEGVALARQLGDHHQLALVLVVRGSAAVYQGDLTRAEECLQEAEALCARLGDRWGRAWALTGAGVASRRSGRLDRAQQQLTTALDIFKSMGDRHGEVLPLVHLALTASHDGAIDRALGLATEALEAAHEVGDRRYQHVAMCVLGRVELSLDHLERARELFVRSIRGFVGSHHNLMVALALDGLARLAGLAGRYADAVALLGFTDRLRSQSQLALSDRRARERTAWLDGAKAALGAQRVDLELHRGQEMLLEDIIDLAERATSYPY